METEDIFISINLVFSSMQLKKEKKKDVTGGNRTRVFCYPGGLLLDYRDVGFTHRNLSSFDIFLATLSH